MLEVYSQENRMGICAMVMYLDKKKKILDRFHFLPFHMYSICP